MSAPWLAVAVGFALVGCSVGGVVGCVGVPPADDSGHLTGTLAVLAPPSLTEVAARLAASFEASHPALTVTVSFAATSELARRVTGPAPPGVLLTDGPAPLASGAASGPSVVFARNQLVVAIAPGNPKLLAGLSDLTRPGLRVVLCALAEPCGAASAAVLAAAGVTLPAGPPSVTRVGDTRAARELVAAGRADAALVYRTDTRLVEDTVATLEVAESVEGVVDYHAVALARAANLEAAEQFVSYLSSSAAFATLSAAGFQLPS